MARDFEMHVKKLDGVKNIENSSGEAPGQFVYTLKKESMSELGMPASVLIEQITSLMNGVTIGTIADQGEDLDIVVKYKETTKEIDVNMIESHVFTYIGKKYRLGDFITANLTNSVASIKREA